MVLNALLSSCLGLKTLELSVDPGRFLAVQDVAVPPVSHLEQLKVDAGVISLRLYAYLREFCEEVNKHFRPCTVDPGRRDPFVSYHSGTDIRHLSSIEYYNMGGSVTRMKKQQKYKQELGIEKIETDIPSPKTASVEQFVLWSNYLSSQQVIEESVNILINGGKKCKTCNIYWNRDAMASKNMLTIATSIWCGNGRPQVFKRHTATSNVVVVAHSGESAT
ncbi:hypothetical protein HMPREF1544_00536 [Mucor circinelloides 1006PhL]|uniref:Uncharacterized protein n=1 Tax=Mucor circinelloides f. circinelloides (strain 1006PhL) TaxID=1220926 RepID=S2KAN8_MUCC1|nr:hypothetical protein HMPREF1544_00536 [Mucor circinelloides 1006PhL]